jgi:hypothetical protein
MLAQMFVQLALRPGEDPKHFSRPVIQGIQTGSERIQTTTECVTLDIEPIPDLLDLDIETMFDPLDLGIETMFDPLTLGIETMFDPLTLGIEPSPDFGDV